MATAPGALRTDARRNRTLILEAVDQLARRGAAVTVSAVARRAGLTRATTYRHFPDRNALLLATVSERVGTMALQVLDEIADMDLDQAMRHLAGAVVRITEEHGHLLPALGTEIETVARMVVPDEPLATELARRRDQQQPSPADEWCARAMRAVCLVAVRAVADGEPAAEVEAYLAATLVMLLDIGG